MDFETQMGILAGRRALRRSRTNWMRRGLFADNGSGDGGGAGGAGDDGGGDNGAGNGDGGEGDGQGGDLETLRSQVENLNSQIEKLNAKNHELLGDKRKAREEAERRRQEAEESARKAGDTEALDKSWRDKFTNRETELTGEVEKLQGMVQDLTAGQEAQRIASDLAVQGSAKALLPHVRSRLKTEIRDGKPATVVLDENGKPSAMTPDELRESFRADPAFAPLIVGSKANGSGGPGTKPAGGGKTITKAELSKLSPKQKAAFFEENPNITVTE